MSIKRFRALVLLACVLYFVMHQAPPVAAQTEKPTAQKFDEFGDIMLSDLKSRLANYAIELQNIPAARGFILVYRSHRDLPGLNSRLGAAAKNYLVYSARLPADRIIVIDGGEAGCLMQELWVVPPGAAPVPRRDAYSRAYLDREAARKFDEFHYGLPGEFDDYAAPESEWRGSVEAFAAALRLEPSAMAHVIVYPQYYIERREEFIDEKRTRMRQHVHLDRRGTAAKILSTVKAELVSRHRIAPSRIKVRDGGYRKLRGLELWIVPRGEHAPVATPNAYPGRRKR